ncbi:hypothetical protein [Clostridium formicaceticum]|uniref:DUF1430 domain-containing protein n=1 Tax=Clostridium formicaceticum TaxID=1497 RepID=A0AAC9WGS7_9CLOT|nr:hypothetical protein [Clostridium formicaceticum]AOY77592.1 hypothetical protein BJL90_18055 [Clostridium formicaceticum]ARE88171.1 hypothetical protein CLFO_25720 [Clostridium formicaceticum]
MKIAKYITSILLTIIVLVFIGETYVWNINGFETEYPYVTYYLQKNTTQSEMISDIYSSANKHNIQVFVVDRKIENALLENISIYGTDGIKTYLSKNSDIVPGTFDSIFLGKSSIQIYPFEDIPDISKINTYRVIGKKEDIIKFKQDLVDKYGGAFPREGYISLNSSLNILLVWVIVLSLFLLLTLYNIALEKKEVIIRLVSGERLTDFVFRKMIIDIVFYSLLFVIIVSTMNIFINATYHLNISIICMVIFIIINSLSYTLFFITDYKKDMATKNSEKRVLRISYIYKIFTIFITIIIMVGCVDLIYEGINFYKQKDFFLKYKDYSYVMLASLSDDSDELSGRLLNILYKKYLSEGKALSLVYLGNDYYNDDNYIFADSGALDYLKDIIPEVKNKKLENKVYFIKPKDYSKSGNEHDLAKDFFTTYYKGNFEYEEIYYENNTEVIALTGVDGVDSTLKKNPVILLNNIIAEKLENIYYRYIWQATMFRISDKEWHTFITENNFQNEIAYKTNAYKNYIHYWQILKRGMIIGIALLGIILLLEGIIINNILSCEYSVNAVELSIKKVVGYGLLGKHKKILITTILFGFIGLTLAVVVSYFLGITSYYFMIAGGLIVILLELVIVVRYVYKLENINVQKILKGGSL